MLLAVLILAISAGALNLVLVAPAYAAPWASVMGNWTRRQQLSLINNSGQTFEATTTYGLSINTANLRTQNEVQADCDDLRVVYQPDDSTAEVLSLYPDPNGTSPETCSSSTATTLYFPLQANISSGATDDDYYLYYANPDATSVSTNDAFNIDTVNAMLICPFDGHTACINADGSEAATTATGAIRYAGSKTAIRFDGIADYGSVSDTASLSVTSNLTVETWVKFKKTSAEQTLIAKWDETTANDDRSYRLYATSGNKFAFSVSTSGTAASTTTITGTTTTIATGTWYHVAGVYNASAQTLNLYVNGTSDATQVESAGSSLDDNASNLYIAGKENTSGVIDTFSNAILSEARISSTNRYTSTFTPSLASYTRDEFTRALFHFDEYGSDPRNTGKAIDDSGNGNHATLTGGVYIGGLQGVDGPSVSGSHTGSSNASILTDSTVSWADNEWNGYIVFNQTDASSGTISSNTANTLTVTLTGGTDNDWDNGDTYVFSPDLGKTQSGEYASHAGVFLEKATTNLLQNPSFEHTTFDTSWVEGAGAGAVVAVTRTVADTGGGTQDITSSNLGGNTPKAVWVIASGSVTDGTAQSDVQMSVGAATGATNEWYISYKDDDAVAGSSYNGDSTSNSDATICLDTATNASAGSCAYGKAEFSAFVTNGVRLNWTDTPDASFFITVIFFAGSSVSAHANSSELGNSTDNAVDITAPGFQPDIVMAGTNNDNTVPAFAGGFGMAHFDGVTLTQRSAFWRTNANAGTTINSTYFRDDGVVGQLTATGNLDWYGELGSFDSSGFTVTTRNAGANDVSLRYLALDFGDTISSWVGTNTTPTSTGNDAETGPGFTPQFVYQIMNYGEAFDTNNTDAKGGTLGFSTFDANEEYANSFAAEDGATTVNTQSLSNDTAVDITDHDGGTGISGSFVSMDATGWTTNYSAVEAAGKLFLAMAVEAPDFLNQTIETNDPYVRFGSKSAKLVASGSDTTFIQTLDPNSTAAHTMSVYVYRGTTGSIGGTIDNTVAQIVWEGANQTGTTYTDLGDGWWRLSYSTTTTDASNTYGIWVADGETIYTDGFVLEAGSTPTTYTDGSLGTGYTWSGTIQESSSTRATADLDYAVTSNVQASGGSASMWVKPHWAGNDGVEHTLFDVDTSAGTFKLYKTTANVLTLTDGTNTATTDISGWTKDAWHHVAVTWDASNFLDIYVDSSAGTGSGAFSAPTLSTSLYVGQSKTNTATLDGVISDLRIFDNDLTSTQISDIYYAGLGSHSIEKPAIDVFTDGTPPVLSWSFDEGYGSAAFDGSIYRNDGTITNATWNTSANITGGTSGTSLGFDGDGDFVSKAYSGDAELNPGTDPFTVGLWFRHESTAPAGTQYLLTRYSSGGYKIYMNTDGTVCFGVDDDATWTAQDDACSASSLTDSMWHHVEAVRSTSSIALYIDGVLVDQDTSLAIDSSLSGSQPTLYVGIDSDGAAGDWDGWIDGIRIFDSAHDAATVKGNFIARGTIKGVATQFGDSHLSQKLSENLVGWWKMDESSWTNDCSTSTVIDSSGSGENGRACPATTGPTGGAAGKFGNSGSFDGNNDYIDLNAFDYLDGKATVSVAAWIKPGFTTTDASNRYIWSVANFILRFNPNQDDFTLTVNPSGDTLNLNTAGLTWIQDTWHHIAATYDGTTAKIYWDGAVIATGTTSGVLDASGASEFIGAQDSTSNFWLGSLDEVRAYTRTLSADDVRTLYQWAPGPVAYYDFNENTGTTSVNDKSGNDITGTMTGTMTAADWMPGKFGSALDFDGTDDAITIATASDGNVDFATSEGFSGGAWVYIKSMPGSGEQDAIITKYDETSTLRGYRLVVENDDADTTGNFQVEVYDESANQAIIATGANDTVSQNTWYYVSFTFNGGVAGTASDLNLYTNGMLTGGNSANASFLGLEDVAADFTIGDYDTTDVVAANTAFTGVIDEVRIYNYARTPSQIIEDMNGGHPIGGSPIGSQFAHWGFDYVLGTTIYDSGPNSKALTINNATGSWTSTGKFQSAFQGADSRFISRSDDNDLDLEAADIITITAWIKTSAVSNDEYLVTKRAIAGVEQNTGYSLFMDSDGDLVFGIGDGTTTFPEEAIGGSLSKNYDDGEWHHVAAMKNGTTSIALYVDGVKIAEDTSLAVTGSLANGSEFRVGTQDGATNSTNFHGVIDEIKLYSAILTPQQLVMDMNLGKAASLGATSTDASGLPDSTADRAHCIPGDLSTCREPVVYLPLDENTGTSTTRNASDLGTDGSMTGFTESDWVRGIYGSALDFDATDDDVAVSSSFPTGSTATVGMWIKPHYDQSSASRRVFSGALTMRMITTIDDFRCNTNTNGTDISADTTGLTWTADTWHYLVCMYDNGTLSIYWDGVLVGTNTGGTGTFPGGTSAFGEQTTEPADAVMDEIKVYDYARTPAQMAWDYDQGAPLAWYKFDECQGTTAYNSAPSLLGTVPGNNGTITAGDTSGSNDSVGTCASGISTEMWNNGTTGKINGSLDFDGTNDYVDIGDIDAIDFNGDVSFSISTWVNRSTFNTIDTIVAKDNDVTSLTDVGYTMYIGPGDTVNFHSGTGSIQVCSATSTQLITSTGWNHIAGVFDAANNTCYVYINGGTPATGPQNGNPTASSLSLRIGTESDGENPFDGQIDDVRIFNYPLTRTQIKEIMNNGAVNFK